jgi:hypothetical protein
MRYAPAGERSASTTPSFTHRRTVLSQTSSRLAASGSDTVPGCVRSANVVNGDSFLGSGITKPAGLAGF